MIKTQVYMNSTSTYPNIKINYMTEENMISLYDYLGKPAGSNLGKAVSTAAKKANIKVTSRDVSNSKYTGKIMLYPKEFLINYFNPNKEPVQIELPF